MEKVKECESIAKKRQPGRPQKTIKKNTVIAVRLSSTEYVLIKNRASQAGLKISSWLRSAAKNARVSARLSPEEMGYLRTLSGIGNNLNQLTKLAHQQGLISLTSNLRAVMDQVDKITQKLAANDW